MSKRTTMILGGIAIAMLAYILLFERGTLSTSELEARRGRVIESFVRARVTRIDLTAGENHVLLTRAEDEGEETLDTFGVGEWSLEAPVRAPAEGESVDGLLSSLEWLDARRTLEGITTEDRARFGFDEPRATVDFTVAGESHHLSVGGDDPRGEGVYVTLDAGDTAWICGRDLLEALQHDADYFRSKDLFPHFRPRDARHVEITNADNHAVVERAEDADRHAGSWRLTEPTHAYARGAAVEGLLQFAAHARATRFLAEEPASDLAAPTRELRIERAPADADATTEQSAEDSDRSPLRLRIIGPCPDHADELVAVVGEGPVVCILTSDIEPLDVSVDQLREMRLVSTPDDRVDSITLTNGASSVTIQRTEEGWRIGEGEDAHDADDDAVGELMHALRAQEAQELLPVTDALIAEHGLASPSAVVTITRTDDESAEIVSLGSSDAVGVWVRRGDEEQVARFDLAVRELVARTPIAFRRRRLAERDAEDATEVRITRGTAEEIVSHAEDGWHVSAPLIAVADEASVHDVARAIAGLEAVRFVAESAAPAHGLDHPRYVVSVHFSAPASDEHEEDEAEREGPIDITVHVGASAEGGAFATLGDDPGVFVVAAGLVDALARPLVSRDLLAIPTGDLTALTITGPNGTVALREQGAGWVTDLGPAASGPTTAMFDRLASLHASGVEAYGTAMPPAVITIEATHSASAVGVTRIEIGPIVAGTADVSPYRLARMSGLAVLFRLPDEAATSFADYRP